MTHTRVHKNALFSLCFSVWGMGGESCSGAGSTGGFFQTWRTMVEQRGEEQKRNNPVSHAEQYGLPRPFCAPARRDPHFSTGIHFLGSVFTSSTAPWLLSLCPVISPLHPTSLFAGSAGSLAIRTLGNAELLNLCQHKIKIPSAFLEKHFSDKGVSQKINPSRPQQIFSLTR